MKIKFLIVFLLFSWSIRSQVGPPSLRCIACNTLGDLTLTWVIPPDPSSQFFSYEIYRSAIISGPYVSVGTVNTHTINSFVDVGANGNVQSKYYFIKTKFGPGGTSSSSNSDTLRSIFLNLTNPGDGTASLVYNQLHAPKLVSTATNFNIYRENPGPAWSNIKNTPALNYRDTITLCNVFYKYQIQISDASGCVSSSNIDGQNFKDLTPPKLGILDSVSVNASGQSILGWKPSPSPDCIGYVIYYFNASSTWQSIDTVFGLNNTSYTSTLSSSNTSIQHCIAAIDSCGNISQLGTDHKSIYLQTTFNLCARTANLNWNSYINMPLGVLKYNVYCSVNATPYTYLGTTTGTTFQHTGLEPNKTYCYLVRAFNTPQSITSTSNRSCLIANAPPATSFVYLSYASVDLDQNVSLGLFCDTVKSCRGFNIYRSDDGFTFNLNGFAPYTGQKNVVYIDTKVNTKHKSYFYRAEIIDSCGNSRYTSNVGKTILLKVKNSTEQIFTNNLTWDNYSSWLGGVAGFNIYRIVNEQLNPTPIDFVPAGTYSYTDNVEDAVKQSGKIGYIVTAIENFGNPYGIVASSSSNIDEAYVEGQVFVPNSFAPKGENRVWKPITQFVEKTDYQVKVFDRWGKIVFATNDENEGWPGIGIEDNIFVYIIQYKNARGEFIEMKGTITLIR